MTDRPDFPQFKSNGVDDPPERDPEAGGIKKVKGWRRAMLIVAFVGLIVGAGSAGFLVANNDRQTHDQLRAERQSLSITRGRLAKSQEIQSTLKSTLEKTKSSLSEAQGELTTVERSNRKLATGLETEGGEIQLLRKCLNGVSMSLTMWLTTRKQTAVNTIQSVQSTCQRAQKNLPAQSGG